MIISAPICFFYVDHKLSLFSFNKFSFHFCYNKWLTFFSFFLHSLSIVLYHVFIVHVDFATWDPSSLFAILSILTADKRDRSRGVHSPRFDLHSWLRCSAKSEPYVISKELCRHFHEPFYEYFSWKMQLKKIAGKAEFEQQTSWLPSQCKDH